jgi:hypothetical protein
MFKSIIVIEATLKLWLLAQLVGFFPIYPCDNLRLEESDHNETKVLRSCLVSLPSALEFTSIFSYLFGVHPHLSPPRFIQECGHFYSG